VFADFTGSPPKARLAKSIMFKYNSKLVHKVEVKSAPFYIAGKQVLTKQLVIKTDDVEGRGVFAPRNGQGEFFALKGDVMTPYLGRLIHTRQRRSEAGSRECTHYLSVPGTSDLAIDGGSWSLERMVSTPAVGPLLNSACGTRDQDGDRVRCANCVFEFQLKQYDDPKAIYFMPVENDAPTGPNAVPVWCLIKAGRNIRWGEALRCNYPVDALSNEGMAADFDASSTEPSQSAQGSQA